MRPQYNMVMFFLNSNCGLVVKLYLILVLIYNLLENFDFISIFVFLLGTVVVRTELYSKNRKVNLKIHRQTNPDLSTLAHTHTHTEF